MPPHGRPILEMERLAYVRLLSLVIVGSQPPSSIRIAKVAGVSALDVVDHEASRSWVLAVIDEADRPCSGDVLGDKTIVDASGADVFVIEN